MIKYLGSKRALAGVLGTLAEAAGASTAVDLFTGTTRVAQEFKRRGLAVTAADLASYSEILARCYVVTDADAVDCDELDALLAELDALPGVRGYVTRTFCEQARYFQPANGQRIDAIRDRLKQVLGRDKPDPRIDQQRKLEEERERQRQLELERQRERDKDLGWEL